MRDDSTPKPKPTPTKPISLAAYGKRRGVSAQAVCDAVRDGRLEKSLVVVKGKPKIADPELADREWHERTRPRIDQPRPGACGKLELPKPVRVSVPPHVNGDPDYTLTYEEARTFREIELWRQAAIKRETDDLDLAHRRGELLTVVEVEARLVDVFTQCRNKLLGVPSRVRQHDPTLTEAQLAAIETHIREALEDLASATLAEQ